MNRGSFFKSLLGLIVAPSIIKDINWENKHEYNWHLVERVRTQVLFEGNVGIDGYYRQRTIPVNPNMCVTMPKGYFNFDKIGMLDSKGNITLMHKRN